MAASLTQYGDVTVMNLKDDLVGQEVESFTHRASQAVAARQVQLVIDMSLCKGIDSAGLEALLDLQGKCETEFGTTKLCGLDETCKRILEITRINRRFEAFDTLEAAVKSFS